MDSITLNFDNPINVSCGVGDIVYFLKNSNGLKYKIGPVTAITPLAITCDISPSFTRPLTEDFIFFAKDTEVNKSGLVGNILITEFELPAGLDAELFAVSSEVIPSS